MNFPHDYSVTATSQPESLVNLSVEGLNSIDSEPPKAFGGSGNHWSPEDLLVSAVADCFVLSFKLIAAASKFSWTDLNCEVSGTLDKVERAIQFTGFKIPWNDRRRFVKQPCFGIQPQISLPVVFVRAMAFKTRIRKNRTDVASKIYFDFLTDRKTCEPEI